MLNTERAYLLRMAMAERLDGLMKMRKLVKQYLRGETGHIRSFVLRLTKTKIKLLTL